MDVNFLHVFRSACVVALAIALKNEKVIKYLY